MKRKWCITAGLMALEVGVCLGMVLALSSGWGWISDIRLFYGGVDTYVQETVEEIFTVDGPATLDVNNLAGHITVTGLPGDEVQVTARLHLWGIDEEDARRRLEVTLAQEGNRVVARAVQPEGVVIRVLFGLFGDHHGSRVDFEIGVPPDTLVLLKTNSGDLSLTGTSGGAQLNADFGDVDVEGVSGPVTVGSSSGRITLTGLTAAGDLSIYSDFGGVELRDVAADSMKVKSVSGGLTLRQIEVAGPVTLETDFGRVDVSELQAASLIARCVSGGIRVERSSLTGAVELETDFGPVEVSKLEAASVTAHCNSGGIQVENVSVTRSADLQTQFGPVGIALPTDAAFDVDAKSDFGGIRTDFAITMALKGAPEEDHVVGEVNGGGPLWTVRTGSGDITLQMRE